MKEIVVGNPLYYFDVIYVDKTKVLRNNIKQKMKKLGLL